MTTCILSRVPLRGYTLITGKEAIASLRAMGFKYLYVNDEGRVRSLGKTNTEFDGYYVYRKDK